MNYFVAGKGKPIIFLKPSLKNETDALVSIKSETLNELSQEQRRLLYVALTRSQDQLYIAGLAKRSKAGEWYALLTEVLQELGVATPDGGWCYQPLPFDKAVKVEEKQKVVELPIELKELPVLSSWMTPRDSKTHIPNSPEQKRGIIIHRLLEILGGLPNLVTLDFTIC
jgi:ATP-dependent exoDNAse (exonuclease V) beta subunit